MELITTNLRLLIVRYNKKLTLIRRKTMNKDIIKGKWTNLTGSVQKKWGKITNDDIAQINGDRTKLVGKIQEAYGIELDAIEKQLKEWENIKVA